jgi:hypothetical protein
VVAAVGERTSILIDLNIFTIKPSKKISNYDDANKAKIIDTDNNKFKNQFK